MPHKACQSGIKVSTMSAQKTTVGVAQFGLGRAGIIHFRNILANRRMQLLWVVEHDEEHAKKELEKHGVLGETKVANLGQIGEVLADTR